MSQSHSYAPARQQLRSLFDAAVAHAYPGSDLADQIPSIGSGRVVVVGAGKAGAAMAQIVEQSLERIDEGLVIVPYGHIRACSQIPIIEAGHPVPDALGLQSAQHILRLALSLEENDTLICLLSGGGSALLNLPMEGISLEEKRAVTKGLLSCGATIHEINTVRKHLSQIKGGRLAQAAYPARTITLAISDVPGNDPSTIASGPTVGDTTTQADAISILHRYALHVPDAVNAILTSDRYESPAPGDETLSRTRYVITATAAQALDTAAAGAAGQGFETINLGDEVEGLACKVAQDHAAIFESLSRSEPALAPLLLSGGELTVRVQGSGRGGPNLEYLLALAIALDGRPDTFALACDTDGIDGATKAAGAIITPDTLDRAKGLGLDARAYLANNDAGTFFEHLDDLIVTGPTCTNVNDFRVIAYIPSSD